MKTLILTVIAIIAILGWNSARADEALNKLLGDKQTEYVGTCRVNLKGEIVFKDEEKIGDVQCVVGGEPQEPNIKFILLWNGDKLSRLVKFTKKTATTPEKQEVIWRNPDGMV